MNPEPMQQEGYDFMAAAFEVYNDMGNGYTEDIYQESLELELTERRISFLAQPELAIHYKGRPLRRKFRPDLMVSAEIVVELKAVSELTSEHEAQLLNYLKLPQGDAQTGGLPGEFRQQSKTRVETFCPHAKH